MSTLTLSTSTIAIGSRRAASGPSLLDRATKNREAAARAFATSFFARLSDDHLVELGFDASDIAALRRGEHRLPKAVRAAA